MLRSSFSINLNRSPPPKKKKNSTADLAAGMEQLRLNPDAREFVPPSSGSHYHHGHHQQHQQQSYAMMLAGAGVSLSSGAGNGGGAHSAPSNGNGGGPRGANGGSNDAGGYFHQQQQHFGGGIGNGNQNGNGNGNGASTSGHSHHHSHLPAHYGGGNHLHGSSFSAPLSLPLQQQQQQHASSDLGNPYRRGKGDARAKAVQRKKNSVQKALEEAGAVQRTVSFFFQFFVFTSSSKPLSFPNSLPSSPFKKKKQRKNQVYVCDIDGAVTEAELAALFSRAGAIVDCRVCGDPNSAMRFAFVEFRDVGAVRNAIALTGTVIGAYPLRVSKSGGWCFERAFEVGGLVVEESF